MLQSFRIRKFEFVAKTQFLYLLNVIERIINKYFCKHVSNYKRYDYQDVGTFINEHC